MCCVTIGVPLQAHFWLQGEKSKEFIKKVAQKVAESVRVIGEQIQPPAFRPSESAHPGGGQPDPCDWFAETPASVWMNRTPNCSTKATPGISSASTAPTASPTASWPHPTAKSIGWPPFKSTKTSFQPPPQKNFSDFFKLFCDKGLTSLQSCVHKKFSFNDDFILSKPLLMNTQIHSRVDKKDINRPALIFDYSDAIFEQWSSF